MLRSQSPALPPPGARWGTSTLPFPPGPRSILATPHSGGPRCPGRLTLATPACLRPGTQAAQPSARGPTTRPCLRWAWPRSPTRHECSAERWAEGSPASPGLPPGRPKPGPPAWTRGPQRRSLTALPVRQIASSPERPRAPASPPPARVGPPGRAAGQSSDPQRSSATLAALRGLHLLHTTRVRRARAPADTHPTTPTHPPTLTPPHGTPRVRTLNRSSVPQPRGIAPTRHGRESHPPKGLWVRRRVAAQGNGGAQLHLPQMIARAGWGWGSGRAWPWRRPWTREKRQEEPSPPPGDCASLGPSLPRPPLPSALDVRAASSLDHAAASCSSGTGGSHDWLWPWS